MSTRIIQGVGMVFKNNQKPYPIRISRAYITSLANYWRSVPDFKYMKIYEIPNYKKGGFHERGRQIGYITLKGFRLDYSGVQDSQKSLEFKRRNGL